MKNSIVTILISVFMLLGNLSIAQRTSIIWQSFYDGPLHREDYFKHLVVDNEGNVYVLCGTKGDVSNYDQDITTYKINTSGQVVWEKHYNGSGSNSLDDPRDIVYDRASGAVICMGRLKDDGIVVIKYDLTGNTQWTYTAPSTDDDVYSMCVDDQGNIYLGGKSRDTESANYNSLLTKLSPDGTEMFRLFNQYGGTSSTWYSEFNKIIPDGSGNILAAGNCKTTNGNQNSSIIVKFSSGGGEIWEYAHLSDSVLVGSYTQTGVCFDHAGNVYTSGFNSQGDNNYNDAIVIKLNLNSGSVYWTKKVDGGNVGYDYVKSIHCDQVGGIYLSTYSRFMAANASTVLIKMNASNGDVLWKKEITSFGQTGNGRYTYNDILVEDDGTFYVAKPHILYNVTKYNNDGDTIWTKRLVGSFIGSVGSSNWMDKYQTTIIKGADDKIYFGCTGTESSLNQDTTDVIITCLSEVPTGINDERNILPNDFALEQNYPNPFNPTTKIKYTISTSPQSPPYQGGEAKQGWLVQLKVFDVLGNEIATLVDGYKPAGNYDIDFDASNLTSGVYLYQLKVGGFNQTKKMLLLR